MKICIQLSIHIVVALTKQITNSNSLYECHSCDRFHKHMHFGWGMTSQTAIYPKDPCELIHQGFDAHEAYKQFVLAAA